MITKGRILRTIGWTTIFIGAYIVYLGNESDGIRTIYRPDDIIEAKFTVLDD